MEISSRPAVIISFIEDPALPGRLRQAARAARETGAWLICADGGGEAALAWGLQPDFLVGDMDSISSEALEWLRNRPGVEVLAYPVEKNETDLELAVTLALDAGARDITILGGLGGRLDHTLGNLYLLVMPRLLEGWARVKILGEREEVFLIQGGQELTLAGEPGELVSLFPLSAQAQGIRTTGLYYPLKSEPLYLGLTRGISNQFTGGSASVTLQEGLLLVIHTFSG